MWAYSAVVEWSLGSKRAEIGFIAAMSLLWYRFRTARKRAKDVLILEFEEVGEPDVRSLHLDSGLVIRRVLFLLPVWTAHPPIFAKLDRRI